jgi:hypothetical protein
MIVQYEYAIGALTFNDGKQFIEKESVAAM